MALSRFVVLVGALLLALAGLGALGEAKLPVEALALFGFACWAGSGAISGRLGR